MDDLGRVALGQDLNYSSADGPVPGPPAEVEVSERDPVNRTASEKRKSEGVAPRTPQKRTHITHVTCSRFFGSNYLILHGKNCLQNARRRTEKRS
jgi:hypothetical protein